MRKQEKKPIWSVLAGALGLTVVGWIIWNWTPDQWWKEVIVTVTGFVSTFLLSSWFWGRKKWGLVISLLIFGTLVLNRLNVLDVLTGMLLVAILGLISLIN